MNPGLYIAGETPLHRLPAGWKLILLFALGLAVSLIAVPGPLAAATVGLMLLFVVAGIPLTAAASQLKAPLLLVGMVFLAHGALTSWTLGSIVALRFAVLILAATLLALTTRVADLMDVFERALQPFRRLGIDPERVGLVLALTIRLIPLLAAQTQEIREAQRARGLDRSWLALIVPLLIRSLRNADELADAIDARGFGAD